MKRSIRSASLMVAVAMVVALLPSQALGISIAEYTFTQSAAVTADRPNDSAVGDFNEDGIADLAVASLGDYGYPTALIVALGGGDATFGAQRLVEVGSPQWGVSAADIDGDGHADLIASLTLEDRVAVARGNGDGTFRPAEYYTTGDSPRSLAVGDLEGDGDVDIVVATPGVQGFSVLVNDGAGVFALAQSPMFPAGRPNVIALGELDGDVGAEIVVSDLWAGTVVVTGYAAGAVEPLVAYAAGPDPRGLRVGDYDGDGVNDVVVACSADDTIRLLPGAGDGTLGAATIVPMSPDSGPWDVEIADFDHDEDVDLLVATNGPVSSQLVESAGDGSFAGTHDIGPATTTFAVEATDLNDDGGADMVFTLPFDAAISVTLGIPAPVSDPEGPDPVTTEPPVLPTDLTVVSIAGANRYLTAVQASKQAFPEGSDAVVIASGQGWADALTGAAFAGAVSAPVLLTEPDALPGAIAGEIERLGASAAYIIGGEAVVSAEVERTLGELVGSVERLAGSDRYQTSIVVAREVAEKAPAPVETAIIATGGSFADALAASPLSTARIVPVVLAGPDGLADNVLGTLDEIGITDIIIVGGDAAVSSAIQESLEAAFGSDMVTRVAGSNRYATSAAVAEYAAQSGGLGWDNVSVATGENFPDALSGGVAQGHLGAVLLLTPGTSLDGTVADMLAICAADVTHLTFLGGDNALAPAVRMAVTDALR